MSILDSLDYGDAVADSPPADPAAFLKAVAALFQQVKELDAEIEKQTAALKETEGRRKAVVEDFLPKLLKGAKMKSVTLDDGTVILLKDHLANSIPKPMREVAWKWLSDNGHADVIKTEVTVAFGVGETDAAKKCAGEIASKYQRSALVERCAEASTVKSILKTRIDAGQPIPRDVFGVREWTEAEFKLPKKAS